MWEAKVFAAVVADAADAVAEINWKHKVTPDQGDLIRPLETNSSEIWIKIQQFS